MSFLTLRNIPPKAAPEFTRKSTSYSFHPFHPLTSGSLLTKYQSPLQKAAVPPTSIGGSRNESVPLDCHINISDFATQMG